MTPEQLAVTQHTGWAYSPFALNAEGDYLLIIDGENGFYTEDQPEPHDWLNDHRLAEAGMKLVKEKL